MAKTNDPFGDFGDDVRPQVPLSDAQKISVSDGATLLHTLKQQAYIDADARIKVLKLVGKLLPIALAGIGA